ncbi:MAG: radical SAM protein [Desulfurococcaceae archaeon]|nr:radical SAM protein [Desulfurococcaceae archaeon]
MLKDTVLVRASVGTLAKLKLVNLKVLEEPTTAYLLQYSERGCYAQCRFCLQARNSPKSTREWLGRVTWLSVSIEELKRSWSRVFYRVCLQTVIKPLFHLEALRIVRELRSVDAETPFSLAITPVNIEILKAFKELGVDALGVGLDATTQALFEEWRKPYSWNLYWRFIEKGVEVYGPGNVYVHLIAGLGESLKEIVETMKKVYRHGCGVALFAYTDARGVTSVDIKHYRLAQLARYLLENGLDPDQYIDYEKKIVKRELPLNNVLEAFYTSGCPHCNRPFYNEGPRGPLYNIPSQRVLRDYLEKLKAELRSVGVEI